MLLKTPANFSGRVSGDDEDHAISKQERATVNVVCVQCFARLRNRVGIKCPSHWPSLGSVMCRGSQAAQVWHNFDIASVIERAKHQHAFEYFADVQHSSLMLYRTMQPEYKSAEYLSVVKCASIRRLVSRFRTGCHGLRVDTGRWADGVHLDRTDRLCQCASHWIVWRTSSTLFLIAQRTATSSHSIWASCSTVVPLQTL